MSQPPYNPYQAPQPPQQPQQYGHGQQYGHQPGMQQDGPYPPCPKCSSRYANPATFTWWGGVLGPKLFNHVNCLQCNTGYNGKTGESNNTKIAIYVGVLTVVSIGVAIVFAML